MVRKKFSTLCAWIAWNNANQMQIKLLYGCLGQVLRLYCPSHVPHFHKMCGLIWYAHYIFSVLGTALKVYTKSALFSTVTVRTVEHTKSAPVSVLIVQMVIAFVSAFIVHMVSAPICAFIVYTIRGFHCVLATYIVKCKCSVHYRCTVHRTVH